MHPSNPANAIVKMIPKPLKNHQDPSNYKQISLLNTLSKLLEHLIISLLQFWIGNNCLLSTNVGLGSFDRQRITFFDWFKATSQPLIEMKKSGRFSFTSKKPRPSLAQWTSF